VILLDAMNGGVSGREPARALRQWHCGEGVDELYAICQIK